MMPERELSLGISSCPNDTFAFCALVDGRVDTGGSKIRVVMEDVEALNLRALKGELDITKLSFAAYAQFEREYALLSAGAALGRGCGPLLVTRAKNHAELLSPTARPCIAIPGRLTTAALLFRLFAPHVDRFLVCPFDQIFDKVTSGEADGGVIIHEGRFTYAARGLRSVVDLGDWWEKETGLPIPLGAIAARRSLGEAAIRRIESWVRQSVLLARANPGSTDEYVRRYAQEMDEAVIRAHIGLYVNDFTVDLGVEGRRAVDALLKRARAIQPPKTTRQNPG